MKRTVLYIFGSFLLSTLTVVLLYAISYKINHSKNGFIRLFPPHAVLSGNTLDIKYGANYIAGFSNEHMYIGNYVVPINVLVSNYNLTDTHRIQLKLSLDSAIAWEALSVSIDSPTVYINDRVTTSLFKGVLGDTCRFIKKLDKIQFSKSVQISPSSTILRTFNKELQQNILTKANITSLSTNRECYTLEKQMDGIFSTDGMLHYDDRSGRLLYVYYYRNRFACLDTNLKVLYLGKTIDTTNTPKISVSIISSEKVSTMSAPPVYVNKKSCVSSDWIFINSGLVANNENKDFFEKRSVIDVYALKDGNYHFSFYLPEYNGTKLTDFRVYDKTLVALYDHNLVTYTLNF